MEDKVRTNKAMSDPNATESELRKQFSKLRRLATIIKDKKSREKKMRLTEGLFDIEAEEGSDNEDHD